MLLWLGLHPDIIGSSVTASWIWLGHVAASRKGMEMKRREENPTIEP